MFCRNDGSNLIYFRKMTEEEFIENAIKINIELGLSREQAEAIARLTVILETKKSNLSYDR